MTKELLILANLTFILIQVIMFIILLKRYIEELKSMRSLTNEEIKKTIKKYKEANQFLNNELEFSFKLIKENINDTAFVLNEINRCSNIVDDFSEKKHIKKLDLEIINLKTLIYDLKQLLYKLNIKIDCDIDNDYYINGDYNSLKEAFILIIKHYYKNNISIKVKKYGKFCNIEFISRNTNDEIENDIVIDYITGIISEHKGIIKIKNKENLKILIIIMPIEKSPKTF